MLISHCEATAAHHDIACHSVQHQKMEPSSHQERGFDFDLEEVALDQLAKAISMRETYKDLASQAQQLCKPVRKAKAGKCFTVHSCLPYIDNIIYHKGFSICIWWCLT